MCLDKSIRKFVVYCKELFGTPTQEGIGGKVPHIKNVITFSQKISLARSTYKRANFCEDLLSASAASHDVGRFEQWREIGCFNDKEYDHHEAGAKFVREYMRQNSIVENRQWQILIDVILYHGRPQMWDKANKDSIPYLEIVTLADDLENGCVGALSYIEAEKARDDKGYIASNPQKNQKDCKPELLEYLARGEKFNKMLLCETYAEYFVFAAMLAVNACVQHGKLAMDVMAVPCYYYEEDGQPRKVNAVDGYCHIFRTHMHPEDAEKACAIMKKMCVW